MSFRISSWPNNIVPLSVELVGFDVNFLHLGLGHADPFVIFPPVDSRLDSQARLRARRTDKLDDNFSAIKRPSPPVPGNVTKHPVFDYVPFAGAGREVAHLDFHAQLVGKLL